MPADGNDDDVSFDGTRVNNQNLDIVNEELLSRSSANPEEGDRKKSKKANKNSLKDSDKFEAKLKNKLKGVEKRW